MKIQEKKIKMGLIYKLLGFPTTIEEMADKAKKSRRVPDVFFDRSKESTLVVGSAPYKYRVGVRVGLFRLITDEWRFTIEGYVPEVDGRSSRLEAEDERAEQIAYDLANRLAIINNSDLVKLNGKFHNLGVA